MFTVSSGVTSVGCVCAGRVGLPVSCFVSCQPHLTLLVWLPSLILDLTYHYGLSGNHKAVDQPWLPPPDLLLVPWDCTSYREGAVTLGCRWSSPVLLLPDTIAFHPRHCPPAALLGSWELTAVHSALFSPTSLQAAVSTEIEQQHCACIIHCLLLKNYSSGRLKKYIYKRAGLCRQVHTGRLLQGMLLPGICTSRSERLQLHKLSFF